MKNVYRFLKKSFLFALLCFVTLIANAQVTTVFGRLKGTSFSVTLTDLGDFRQGRQVAPTSSNTNNIWAFRDASKNWGDPNCAGLGIPGFDQVVVPNSPKTYGFAQYIISGGCYERMPATSNGYYYTFNITEKTVSGTRVDEDMAILETSYNPVSISSVSKSPSSPNSIDTVTVTANTSASLSTGEYLYLRYSTSSTFSTSTVVEFSMSGSSGTAKIPPHAGSSTVYYYVFSSNRTSSQLSSSVSTYGQVAYNLLTLDLNNNSTSNYSYSVTPCATAPTSITSSVAGCLKSGNSTTLTQVGGSLPSGGSYKWYEGGCGSGTAIGTGSSITVSPTTTTNYYVRAEDGCGNTVCASIRIQVGDSSLSATSITGIDTICQNVNFVLKRVGGTLGTGASWKWYSVACGGPGIPYQGTGDSIFVNQGPGNHTYYLRAEGLCNNTICATKSFFVRDSSTRPSATVDSLTTLYCIGNTVTMYANTGTLGAGANWKWYSGSCGGTLVGTGSSLSVVPAAAGVYTYYRRAEGICNTTQCAVYKFKVQDTSYPATSISGPTAVCQRSAPMVFKPVGGSLSAGGAWTWTRAACYGSAGQVGLGSGDSLSLTTAALGLGTHNIYVRGLNGCNTIACASITLTISDTSEPASSISGTSTICLGQTSTLTFSGGKLGAGASWKWYTSSCGGTLAGTGTSLSVSPATAGTYTYYLRAEGTCNNTSCVSYTVTIRDTSVLHTSVTSNLSAICLGQQVNLAINGGSLGHGASWKWYSGSCGGTSIGTGSAITWGPPSAGTITVYGRAEGTCNNTLCKSVSIVVRDTSVPATSITGIDTICQNVQFKLKRVGGSLGLNATWKWYSVACGGPGVPYQGTGDSIFVNQGPGNHTYYLRAEGFCNNTICATKSFYVRDSSVRPNNDSLTTLYCIGNTVTMYANTGTLGAGASTWKWYSGSCGGTLVGTGSTLSVVPTAAGVYTYYRRAEGICNNTQCAVYKFKVQDTSHAATSITGPTAVCQRSAPLVFKPVGGSLSAGAAWTWTRVACYGSSGQVGLGAGDSLSITTAALGLGTHTIYVRGLNGCNATACASITLTISDTSVPATSISGTSTICQGQSSSLTFSGGKLGAGASWKWYTSSCGGTLAGTGTSLSVSPATAGTYTYYLRAEGTCNNTVCRSFTLTVRDTSVPAVSVSGTKSIFCLSDTSVLTLSGGTLGTGASWKWYIGTCGGTSIGTGTTHIASPNRDGIFTYYVRAEGTCNNTICKTYTITVNDTSVPANSISGTSTICKGQSSTLSLNGGSLGTSASWKWYLGSCSGTSVATGSTLVASPTASGTYTYYVRAEGTCNTTACRSFTLTVSDTSTPVTSASASATTICKGQSTTLTKTGGSLGTGATWKWYSGSCSGAPEGSGSSLSVTPASTTTYYIKAEGTCNTTACQSVTITVRDTSVPTNSISGTTTICKGQSTTFSLSGGSLGTGGSWKWYSGSCGGTSVGTGSTLSVSPAAGTYTYYVRAEGTCNNTVCKSVTLTVNDTSVPATSATASSTTICRGQSTTLSKNGGSLGTGATWEWYSGSCSGTPVGSGSSFSVTPSTTTTYYVKAEGTCNTTACQSVTITVRDTSVPATVITGTATTICKGASVTMTINGGSLGTGATWKWYSGSCGGTSVGTGTSLTVTPSAGSFTYYARAEGTCNTTACKSYSITVNDTSVPASSIAGTSLLCKGQSSTLSTSGGSLGTGATWKWYSGSCSGTSAGTGTSLSVTPSSTTTYYVRAEGTCNNTVCKSVTVTVSDTNIAPTSISGPTSVCQRSAAMVFKRVGGTLSPGASWTWTRVACHGSSGQVGLGSGDSISFTTAAFGVGTHTVYVKAVGGCNNSNCVSKTVTISDTSVPATSISGTSTICAGQSSTLSVSGGKLGAGASWKWYTSSCGGTLAGTGTSLAVSPATAGTYTYYVRAEGSCNTTTCQSFTVTVRDTSVPASSISGTTTICKGQSSTFTLSGGSLGTGATWKWYNGSCGGTSLATGTTLTVTPSAGTYTYYVRAEGTCNNTSCKTVTLTVNDTSVPANSISGTSTICKGQSSTLSISGGSLGTGGSWKWYLGSCSGTSVASGTTYTASPASAGTYTYYVRAEGTCNTTACRSFTLTVSDTSTPVTTISGTSTLCKGQSSTLSISGGSLGTGATWKWYSGSCGGTSIGTGTSLSVTPSTTTTYYVRAEGTCNNTVCKSVTVTVRDTSEPATTINAADTTCNGQFITFTLSGGKKGHGAAWNWYSSACGGTGIPLLGTGDTLKVKLGTGNHSIYLRAQGTCNTTKCINTTITVVDTSIKPSTVTANAICLGSTATLSVSGGKLGYNANWKWYSTCGGTSLGTGSTLSVTPTVIGTYTYYVRAEGPCNNTGCATVSLTVNDTNKPATSISGPTSICQRSSAIVFKPVGGKLSQGGTWNWTRVACYGSSGQVGLGSGDSLSLTTASLGTGTHTIYLKATGGCNSTACISKTITISDTGIAPTSVSASPSTICVGETSTLTVSGGQTGSNGSWKWYTTSCGVASAGTGSSISVSPGTLGSTTYYVRAEGTCGNTICKTVVLTVRDTSRPVVSFSGTTTICLGTNTTISINGGSLATGASWKWYSGACGTGSVGSGSSLVLNPATTTTYYVRAEGGCKNSPCNSVVITVRDTSKPASSITGTTIVCKGSSTTLSVNGGALGSGASWKWYSGSCSGTSIGTGSSISVSPASNTSYFVRAEGTCNSTICRTVNVTVRDTSIPALFISGNTTICRGQSNTFTLVGGTLGTGASWKWYNSSCGVGAAGTGTTLTVTPTTAGNYTYYLRAEGTCGNSACISVTLTVRDTSTPASSISGTTTLCKGQSTTLSVVGGSLGHSASWKWYQGSCLGSFAGTGSSLTLSNLAPGSYTYYVRAEGTCNTTICKSISLTVRDTSTPATSIIGTSTICKGQSSTLTLTGGSLGTGATWKWYLGSCGGTSIGSGTSITATPAAGTYTYYVRAEGLCNNTICQSFTLTVRDTSVPASSVTGTLSTLCVGQSTTLSVNGGSLGTNASWKWYLGSCGFTTVSNTGSTYVLNPTVAGTYTYYVRAEGTCNTTICRSFTITVRDTSVAPSAITGTAALCQGQKSTLAMTGGYLGTGATWKWYLGSCGGTAVATGVTSLTVSPATAGTYTYFVRAEGVCNNTICRSFTITMRDTSGKPISIAGPDTVCEGVTINLSRNGGQTGTGAVWNWYSNACGGSGVPWLGKGDNLSIKMPSGVNYFYLKAEGGCNTTACVVKKVVVVDSSIRPTSVNEFFTTCLGNKRTLTVNGGRLGYKANWKWFATCGGTVLATGPSLTVTPTAPGLYTYYVRAEGLCNTTPCAAITFTVIDSSKPATAISGPTSVCPDNTPFTLKRVGGQLSSGAKWEWYRVACGGPGVPWIGTGDSITLTPQKLGVGTHVIYLKANGGCNTTACVSLVITVRQAPGAPSAITGISNICKGESTTLSVGGGIKGTDANWTWYSGSCGGSPLGTGNSIVVSPADTTTYFVRSEGPCGITTCASVRVDVIQTPQAPVAITANYAQACAGTPVKLYANGPALINGESRKWYINNAGTLTPIGTGDSITVTLSNTADIELRTENRCFNSTSVTKQISILNSPVGTWVGIKNSNWHESDNWCGGIPTASTDVVIPSGTPYQPVIGAYARVKNLTINAGANLTVSSAGNLEMNGSLTKTGSFTSNGGVIFRSGGAVTTDGFVTRDLEIGLAGDVTLNGNITVSGNLKLANGSVFTGSYEVSVTNDNANAVTAGSGNNNFRNSWISGNLRRSIKTVDSVYNFPVGSIAEGNNAEFSNHNVAGVSTILAHFRPKPGNDIGLNVVETATSNPYGSVSNGGVWYLEPNGTITSGNFDLKLWFHNQATFTTGLVDNSFSILNRPASSTLASDWTKPATNSTYVAGTVSSGYVQRNGISIMGQFGLGITLYPVSVKNTSTNNQVQISPNPFNASFNVNLNLTISQKVSIKVYDQSGRMVINREAGKLIGNQNIAVDAATLSEGAYTVVIDGDNGRISSAKLIKINR